MLEAIQIHQALMWRICRLLVGRVALIWSISGLMLTIIWLVTVGRIFGRWRLVHLIMIARLMSLRMCRGRRSRLRSRLVFLGMLEASRRLHQYILDPSSEILPETPSHPPRTQRINHRTHLPLQNNQPPIPIRLQPHQTPNRKRRWRIWQSQNTQLRYHSCDWHFRDHKIPLQQPWDYVFEWKFIPRRRFR